MRIIDTARTRLDRWVHRLPLVKSLIPARRRPVHHAIETAARIGYGALGFVYLSAGVLTLLAALGVLDEAAGSQETTLWLAAQPLGRVWLLLLGLGLLAFVQWCVLQSVFDADHEGRSRDGLMKRAGQGANGLVHLALALTALRLLWIDRPAEARIEGAVATHDAAARVLAFPSGDLLLIGVGLIIIGIGIGNVVNGLRADFTGRLTCSETLCRRLSPLAKAGNVAKGVSLLPLGVFVVLGGLSSRASEVRTFGDALDGLAAQPAGPWVLGCVALGFIAFGLFSFIEARFRRISPPRDLSVG
ncbi:DUF1206 domain-containing protein [Brevundimonas sp.]|uniref:DUF1206 domain-containing protein n=1 Tax=Brevundimonas sp. TaxID=1871086 RepID=UPI0025C18C29|nr:DUF1206 domain-containing protein [Brevundimonas sp.]